VSTGAAVARLVDTHAPEVRVRAPIELAEHLAVGTTVRLRTGKEEGLRRISALVPVGDEASRQLELRITLEDGAPPVGSAVEVGLPRATPRQVVAVPRDAVVLRREGAFVLRVDGQGKAERLPVKPGEEVDGMVEVAGAVAPGDRLIVRGGERIEPGQAVTIRDWSQATATAAR
jgi:hypothetical protein